MTRQALAELISSFLNGGIATWAWDDFISVRQKDPMIEAIRQECVALPETCPPERPSFYCNARGLTRLAEIAAGLADNRS
jgi:hypothetical protein